MGPRSASHEPVQPRRRFVRGALIVSIALLASGCSPSGSGTETAVSSTTSAAEACATLRSAIGAVSPHLGGVRAGEPEDLDALAEGTETLRSLAASVQDGTGEPLAPVLVADITAAYAAHAALLAATSARPVVRRAVSDAETTRTDAVEAALAACS